MYPDCHAQEAVQGKNKSVSPVPNGFNILGYFSFALLACGLLLESTLLRLLMNDEAKAAKSFLLCVVNAEGYSVFSLRVSGDCGKLNNLPKGHQQVHHSLGKEEYSQMQTKRRD